jgi:hypothetical protein
MFERIRQSFQQDFWRSLFYASLAFLVFAFAVRLLIPAWVYFGSAERGYYRANRWTGQTYFLVGINEYPVQHKEKPDEP